MENPCNFRIRAIEPKDTPPPKEKPFDFRITPKPPASVGGATKDELVARMNEAVAIRNLQIGLRPDGLLPEGDEVAGGAIQLNVYTTGEIAYIQREGDNAVNIKIGEKSKSVDVAVLLKYERPNGRDAASLTDINAQYTSVGKRMTFKDSNGQEFYLQGIADKNPQTVDREGNKRDVCCGSLLLFRPGTTYGSVIPSSFFSYFIK